MREELARVLAYPSWRRAWPSTRLAAADVLAAFDRHARLVEAPPKAPVTCGDPDDQKFIDLAVRAALHAAEQGRRGAAHAQAAGGAGRGYGAPPRHLVG